MWLKRKMLREMACYRCISCEPATKLLLFVSFVYIHKRTMMPPQLTIPPLPASYSFSRSDSNLMAEGILILCGKE